MSKRITPTVEREVLTLAAKGNSSRQIAAHLKSKRGITVSHQAVGNLLRKTRTERADVAKAVTTEVVGKELNEVLAHLSELRKDLKGRRERAGKAVDDYILGERVPKSDGDGVAGEIKAALVWGQLFTKLAELELKAIQHTLHFGGADSGDDTKKAPPVHVIFPPESD